MGIISSSDFEKKQLSKIYNINIDNYYIVTKDTPCYDSGLDIKIIEKGTLIKITGISISDLYISKYTSSNIIKYTVMSGNKCKHHTISFKIYTKPYLNDTSISCTPELCISHTELKCMVEPEISSIFIDASKYIQDLNENLSIREYIYYTSTYTKYKKEYEDNVQKQIDSLRKSWNRKLHLAYIPSYIGWIIALFGVATGNPCVLLAVPTAIYFLTVYTVINSILDNKIKNITNEEYSHSELEKLIINLRPTIDKIYDDLFKNIIDICDTQQSSSCSSYKINLNKS